MFQGLDPLRWAHLITEDNPGSLAPTDWLEEVLILQLLILGGKLNQIGQPGRPGEDCVSNPVPEVLALRRGENPSCDHPWDLLLYDPEHSFVVDEEDGPHVVEAADADLAEHFWLQRTQLALVQLQSDLMYLLHCLAVVRDEEGRRC